MSSFNSISPDKLWRLVGVPDGPALIDVRSRDAFAADPRLIPGPCAELTRPYRPGPRSSPGGRPRRSARTDVAKAKALRLGCVSAEPLPRKFSREANTLGPKRVSRSYPRANCRSAICKGEQCG